MRKPPIIQDAAGLRWRPRANGWVGYWVARADIVARGYPVETSRVYAPKPWREPDADDIKFIRSECSRLQSEMLGWARGGDVSNLVFTGTVASLIDCYERDPDSPFHKLRFASKKTYRAFMRLLEQTVGERVLSEVRGRDLRRWYENYSTPSDADGPKRIPRAHAAMTMFRMMLSFGVSILEDEDCARLKAIMSEMQFAQGRSRVEEITAEQSAAVIAKAHEIGRPSVALAQALQFELVLRQKDVVGEWVPLDEPGLSDMTRHGRKWLYGIDWREISEDLTLTHRLSKSLKGRDAIADRHAGKTKIWDLKLYPMVMAELARIPKEQRVGPLIINERTALPYVARQFEKAWRKAATLAGVPANVQNRDSRAGGITEGIEASDGDMEAARNAAGHRNVSTTRIYNRGEHRQTAKVAQLRAAKRTEKDSK